MRKFSLLTAVLLLSCAWAVAQTSPSSSDPSTQNPSSTSPSTQSPSTQSPSTQTSPSSTSPSAQQPESSSSGEKGSAIEGCLSGSAGNFTLTDASGTTYQLAGDTSKLADHVGHQIRVWGEPSGSGGASATGSSSAGSATASAGSSQTINIKRVKMVSSSCSNK